MPDGPKLTEKDLEQDGFGAKPFFECLVAYDPAKPEKLIGFVLFFYTYSTWEGKAVFMEDLYVTPTYRGKGIGTNLWKGVVQVSSNFQNNKIYIRQIGKYMNKMKPIFFFIKKAGLDINCHRCNWNVLDWNKPSIDFYKSKGGIDLTEKEGWLSFRLTRSAMEAFVKS